MSDAPADRDNSAGAAGPSHPAPARGRVSGLRITAGIAGAPLAWLAQMSLSEPLAAQSCYPGNHPLAVPMLPSLRLMLAAISVACLLAALACGALAWRDWRATRAEQKPQPTDEAVDTGVGGTRFLAMLGLMSSGLFAAAILFTALAALLIVPCGGPA
jgi:hypothetical protein